MTISVYNITGTAWTPITTAGLSGTCWIQEIPNHGQVVINHSETLTEFDIDESFFLLNAKRKQEFIGAESISDIYYAKCSLPTAKAVLVVDIGAGFIGDPVGKIQPAANGGVPVYNIDTNSRVSLNTVFGEKVIATRVSNIAAQFQYGVPAGSAEVEVSNGGTISTFESLLIVSTGTDIAGAAAIANRKALRYLPGQEAFSNFTAVFTAPEPDSYQRAGLFNENDGFFIGYEGTDFCVTRRRNSVDTKVTIDLDAVYEIADGVFDPANGNVYRISFGYLGFASISFEIMTPSAGWLLIHKIEYPNSTTVTHITNTNLQPRVAVANTGNNTDLSVRVGSFSAGVIDGGGFDPAARRFTFARVEQTIVAGTLMVVTFRSKETFSGLVNYISSMFTLLSFNADLSKSTLWELEKNGDITNTPTWTDVDTGNSTIEYSIDAVVTPGTGTLDFTIPLGRIDRELISDIEDQQIELLPNDHITLFILSPGGTNGTYDYSFRWKELF